MALAAILPMTVMAADGKASCGIKVKITAGGQVLTATFQDNATSRALAALFPLTVPMMDLYSRELVYRFAQPLPAEQKTTSGYDVGDIVYWAPRHSFVIMYAQNGERISELQKVGRIDSGVEKLANVGDIHVLFELMPP
ncbi:cyclophilin-like fold protein [Comamonas sp.]|nr:cyclophilin-like fold protein [Comamonas sp.]